MPFKEVIAYTAVSISTLNFLYYMYTVYWGKTRPHLYTWLIWGLVTGVACAAQFADGAGTGAWLTLAVTFFCFGRVAAAITHGVKDVTRSDKICLIVCILAIVVWQLVGNPLVAVIIVTAVDLAGFYPTVRNAWKNPNDENAFSFFLFATVYALGLMAIENYTLTTTIYPAAMVVANWGFVVFLLFRRKLQQA